MNESTVKRIVAVLLLLAIVTSVAGTFTVLQRVGSPLRIMKIGPPVDANLGFSVTGAVSGAPSEAVSKEANLGFNILK